MSTTKLRDLPPYLQDRYGYRRTPRFVIGLTLVLAIVVVSLGSYGAYKVANPAVRSKLLVWSAREPTHVDVTFEVRRSASQPVDCALRVQDDKRQDVGYAVVNFPAGTPYVQETYSVATRKQGAAAEVLGCAPTGQLRVSQPDFPPGTVNPPQPWSPA